MIINLLVLVTVLAMGAVAGMLLTVRHFEHIQAERQADEDRLAEFQELYAAWAEIRARESGGRRPSGHDPRDRIPI